MVLASENTIYGEKKKKKEKKEKKFRSLNSE